MYTILVVLMVYMARRLRAVEAMLLRTEANLPLPKLDRASMVNIRTCRIKDMDQDHHMAKGYETIILLAKTVIPLHWAKDLSPHRR